MYSYLGFTTYVSIFSGIFIVKSVAGFIVSCFNALSDDDLKDRSTRM